MDMNMPGMDVGGDSSSTPLNDTGVDFSNATQAMEFLGKILDDSELQIDGNAFARYFWYGIVVVIGIAAIFNIIQRFTLQLRIRAAAVKAPYPAKPSNILTRCMATITAIAREVSYVQLTPARRAFWFKVPPLGTICLLLAYLGFVLALEFINNDVPGAQHYTALGVRAGWLAVAQVPLLILLAGKNNLIGFVTGVSYERLNVLHRWVARMLLLLATLHLGYQNYGWNEYGLMQMEWSTDSCPPTGVATYAILLWINLSTLAPLRNLSYEFFVVQHILTFFGFIIAVMLHLPSTALYSRVYIYIPIALYFLDRLIRTSRYAYNNIRPSRATLSLMNGGVTKIRVPVNHIKKWKPGAHVLLSIPRLGAGQSHPATIASRPSSHGNDLIFILKAHRGFTRRLITSAGSSTTSLLPKTKQEAALASQQTHTALIDGPYGGSQADFAAFDTVLLIAGSTGVTFTLSLLLDIAHRATSQRLPVRRLEFVWVVKNTSWTSWITEEFCSAFKDLGNAGIEIEIKIFVTCDEAFIEESNLGEKTGCQCDKSLGPCCCVKAAQDADSEDASRSNSDISTDKPNNENNAQTMEITPAPAPAYSSSQGAPCCSKKDTSLSSIAAFKPGRPPIYELIWDVLEKAEGETGIATCGPLGLNATVRTTVAKISDERAVHKGTGAQGVYLHAEGFGW
ncbi:hypothetical protein P7C71_g5059, partial [Lecanoromycetidae sp. Uapishka_2]